MEKKSSNYLENFSNEIEIKKVPGLAIRNFHGF